MPRSTATRIAGYLRRILPAMVRDLVRQEVSQAAQAMRACSLVYAVVDRVFSEDGIEYIECTTRPAGVVVVASLGRPLRSAAERCLVGDLVVVGWPGADPLAEPVVLRIVSTEGQPDPDGVSDGDAVLDGPQNVRITAVGDLRMTAGGVGWVDVPAEFAVRRSGSANDRAVLNTPLRAHLLNIEVAINAIGAHLFSNTCRNPSTGGEVALDPQVAVTTPTPPIGSATFSVDGTTTL